jgi:hypothetical protein
MAELKIKSATCCDVKIFTAAISPLTSDLAKAL